MSSHRSATDQTLQSTRLIVFLGTPHRGSHLLDKPVSNLFLSAMKMGNKEVPKNIKTALQPRRPDVFAANTDFMQVKGKIAIVNFYEQVPTRMSELVSPTEHKCRPMLMLIRLWTTTPLCSTLNIRRIYHSREIIITSCGSRVRMMTLITLSARH